MLTMDDQYGKLSDIHRRAVNIAKQTNHYVKFPVDGIMFIVGKGSIEWCDSVHRKLVDACIDQEKSEVYL